ncbi:MAG: hypothetical protein RLZZ297_1317, partial [Chloroflexota bacterium]
MYRRPHPLALLIALVVAVLASSCQIEGGVRDRTPVVPNTTPDAILAPTNQSVADALAQRNDVWAIGITELPGDLFP